MHYFLLKKGLQIVWIDWLKNLNKKKNIKKQKEQKKRGQVNSNIRI